ncbi:MAG: futalosine hydrolase [Geobacteraceae bacterium]|nr:futalosine hydrolase [Geobacteraceae bacterium]
MTATLIISATPGEITDLAKAFRATPEVRGLPWEILTSTHNDHRLIFASTGIGAANCAAAASLLLHIFSPRFLIMTGCAGAYPGSGLRIGDLAVATREIFADIGVLRADGIHGMKHMGLPLLERNGVPSFNDFPLSTALLNLALKSAAARGTTLRAGSFLTVSACSGTLVRGEELRTRFGAICENMEGAAAALVSARFGVDLLEVRGISNHVEDRDVPGWDIPLAVKASTGFLESFIRELTT